MSLLTPMFLAGLAALAAPVLLHLVDRADRAGARFPSLMFVQRLNYRARRRRVLRDRALLALRCLALVLLVLAFARPFVQAERAAQALPGADLVVLLDRSYSMAAGERWSRAVAIVGERLSALGDDDRVALVLFDEAAEVASTLDEDRSVATARLAAATPGSAGTDFRSAASAASGLLAASPAARRRVLLVSDLQRVGMVEGARPALPAGVAMEVAGVGDQSLANASLELLETRAGGDGGQGLLALRLGNPGAVAVDGLRLRVEVEDREVAERRVGVAAGGEQVVELPLPAAAGRPLAVTARISGDDLAADDAVHLVLAPDVPLRVLLVLPEEASSGRGVFVERALGVSRGPAIDVRRLAVGSLDAAALAAADVIVLDDAPLPVGATLEALRARVRDGAGLLLVTGERLGDGWPDGADWLPGRPGPVRETVQARAPGLRWKSDEHPLAAMPDAEAVLADAAVRRRRVVEPREGDTVLAVFDDDAPALLERSLGAGRVMLYASTLDPRWSGLVATPGFAPLIVQTVRHLAGRGAERAAWRVGEAVDLARHAASLGAWALAAHLRAGGGALVRLPDGASSPARDGLLVVAQAGLHELHAVGADLPPVPLAVNVDTRESDTALLQPQTLLARFDETTMATAGAEQALQQRMAERGADRLWWWLLLAATLALLAESLVAARLAGARRRRSVPGGGA